MMCTAQHAAQSIRLATVAALLIALALLSIPTPATAQNAETTFRLGPGGSATITFVAYCTEFGKFFPQQIQAPSGDVAPDSIRAALAYINGLGIADDNAKALEANFAIWQIAGAQRATGGGTLTQDIKDNAKTAPAAPAGALSVLDAQRDGKATITLDSWAPIGPKAQILSASDNFYGRGTVTVTNTSTEVLTLYMPTGTLFPGSEARFQVMGAYAEDVSVVDAQLPSTGTGDEQPLAAVAMLAVAMLAGGFALARSGR